MTSWRWTLAIAWFTYATSSLDRLAGGDSGELLSEACLGGVAHPPGYPLLLALLRAVHLGRATFAPHVPFVALANNLNAFFAAGAAACVAHSVELVVGVGHSLEAISGGLIFAFSALTWEYALGLEVFALNNLLCGLVIASFIRHCAMPHSMAPLYLGAFVCGLGLTNQHTIVLLELPLIGAIVVTTRFTVGQWFKLSLCFLSGLYPYVYLYLAALTPTVGTWGDCSTLSGFITHLLRREYGTFKLSPQQGPSETFLSRLEFQAADTTNELPAFALACIIVGVAASILPVMKQPPATTSPKTARTPPLHARRRVVFTLVLAVAFYSIVFNSLANIPLEEPLAQEVTRRFFMQPTLIMCILVGIGLASLRQYLLYLSHHTTHLASLLTVLLVAYQYHRNHTAFHSSIVARSDLIHQFGSQLLTSLPHNAVLLSYTDIQWNAVRYLQSCERVRPDVTHINLQVMAYPWFPRQHHLYPSVSFPPLPQNINTNRSSQGFATYLSRFLEANPQHTIFLDLHGVDETTITSDQLLFGIFQAIPHGLVWHISPSSSPRRWKQLAFHASSHTDIEGVLTSDEKQLVPRGSWEFVALAIANDAKYQRTLARLGYLLAHDAIHTVEELVRVVLAYDAIQRELREVVADGAVVTYDRYGVAKNAVVARLRFQLYLDALVEATAGGDLPKQAVAIVRHRVELRSETIEMVEAFVGEMVAVEDSDVGPVKHGLEALKAKAASDSVGNLGKTKKKKKKKKARKKRV